MNKEREWKDTSERGTWAKKGGQGTCVTPAIEFDSGRLTALGSLSAHMELRWSQCECGPFAFRRRLREDP